MTNILHLDSSPRGNRSKSRQLAKEFMTKPRPYRELEFFKEAIFISYSRLPTPDSLKKLSKKLLVSN